MIRSKNLLLKALFIFTTTLGMISCDRGKPANQEAVREEMESRKIQRISTAELLAKGEEMGNYLTDTTQQILQQALRKAIEMEGIAGAIQYCNLNAYDLVRELEDSLGVTIRRVSHKVRNPKNQPDSLESLILEAYEYSPVDARPQVLELDTRTLIYTKPIFIAGGLCLNCHGTVGQQIQDENAQLLKSLYPGDQATGYQFNDFRGMWSVRMLKSTIVKSID